MSQILSYQTGSGVPIVLMTDIMTELAQMTPPIGFNLFILQGLTGHPIGRVAIAALPFFGLMCVAVVIITAFPQIALWLPSALFDLPKG